MKLYKLVFSNPIHFISFGFGSGLAPVAPGTFGTLMAVPIYFYISPLPILYYLLITTVIFFIGCWTATKTSNALGVNDHSGIVIDEIVGYLITMCWVPFSWQWAIVGFLLFRLFDIWKPWPISIIDRSVHSGFGVMLDDVVAGIYGLLSLHIVIWSAKFI